MTPRFTARPGRAALLALTLALGACGGDAPAAATDAADASGDALDLTGRSVYHLELAPKDLAPMVLDRDLSDAPAQHFAFGSTHIGPAVALTVADQVSVPRTISVILNFGIVVPSAAFPVHTAGPGTYPFGGTPPELELTVSGLEYRSGLPGSDGAFVIDAWSVTPGDAVRGRFSGRVLQDTTLADKRWVDVSGWFHFTLPPLENGQPQ